MNKPEPIIKKSETLPPPAPSTNNGWISVKDRLPEKGQSVAFVVKSSSDHYNGMVLGGRFQGCDFDYPEFTTPGHGWVGVYWMPLPEPPKQ